MPQNKYSIIMRLKLKLFSMWYSYWDVWDLLLAAATNASVLSNTVGMG